MEGESQNARDARVEKLWQDLDTRKEGQLDIKALKKGLRKIDHRECVVALLTGGNIDNVGSSQKCRWHAPRCIQSS